MMLKMKNVSGALVFFLMTGVVYAQHQIDTIIKITNPQYAYPTWSPDGNQILFEADVEGNWEIYRMDRDGFNIKRLTQNKVLDRMPNWSVNNEIVFISDRDGDYEVYKMDLDGNLQTQLTNNQTYEIHPYWSPDGNTIIYNSLVQGTRTYDIRTMSSDGSNIQVKLNDDDLNSYAQISPDGKKIVFDKWQGNNDKNGEIYMMDGDGENLKRLTNNEDVYDGYPTWFSDSETILFSSEVDSVFKLFAIKADGKSLKQLSFGLGDDQRANVSKSTGQIVFNRNLDGDINIYTINPNIDQSKEVSINSDSIVKITDPEYAYAHWSPDGKKLVYQAKVINGWDIFIMDEDGGNIKNLSQNIDDDTNPAWSPDGKWIAFVSNRDGDNEIFIMDIEGKEVKQLTENELRDIHPYWSPDSKSIIFNSSGPDNKLIIKKINIENLQPEVLLEDKYTNSYASFSEDGSKIVYVKWLDEGKNGEIYVMDLLLNKETRLTNNSVFDGYPTWFPDNDTILFSSEENGVFKLFTIKTDGSALKELSSGENAEVRANVSKDGRKIVTNKYVDGRLNLYVVKLK